MLHHQVTKDTKIHQEKLEATLVTPAIAWVQLVYLIVLMAIGGRYWIPAFAGMTLGWCF
jgi:hypothetical protein